MTELRSLPDPERAKPCVLVIDDDDAVAMAIAARLGHDFHVVGQTDPAQAVEAALRENEARLRMALEAAKAGTWEWDLATHQNIWSDEVFRLRGLGHPLQQAFERYYIAISVLVKNGSGTLGSAELETLCQQAAQRLSLLYAPAAPEFFDKNLFRGFIQQLRGMRMVWTDEAGKLVFDDRLKGWAKDARVVLGRELRHTIEKVSPDTTRVSGEMAALPPDPSPGAGPPREQ